MFQKQEQNYLRAFYRDRIFVLPSVYNVLNNDKTKAAARWHAIESQIVILHFVAKPWFFTQCFRDLVEVLSSLPESYTPLH